LKAVNKRIEKLSVFFTKVVEWWDKNSQTSPGRIKGVSFLKTTMFFIDA
jgi:hypothetical protein